MSRLGRKLISSVITLHIYTQRNISPLEKVSYCFIYIYVTFYLRLVEDTVKGNETFWGYYRWCHRQGQRSLHPHKLVHFRGDVLLIAPFRQDWAFILSPQPQPLRAMARFVVLFAVKAVEVPLHREESVPFVEVPPVRVPIDRRSCFAVADRLGQNSTYKPLLGKFLVFRTYPIASFYF